MAGDEMDLLWKLDATDRIGLNVVTGSVTCYTVIGGTFKTIATFAFDPVLHRYWKLRESAGTTSWETSPDAASWTSPPPFALSSIQVGLSSGTRMPVSNPGTAIYGHFDMPWPRAS